MGCFLSYHMKRQTEAEQKLLELEPEPVVEEVEEVKKKSGKKPKVGDGDVGEPTADVGSTAPVD